MDLRRQQQLYFLRELRNNYPGLNIENTAKFYKIYNRQIDSGKTDQEAKEFIYSVVPFILNMQQQQQLYAEQMPPQPPPPPPPPPQPPPIVGGKRIKRNKRKSTRNKSKSKR